MIRKIYLYAKALYKGELLKKLEYKFKDLTKYFYLRNKIDKKNRLFNLKNISLDIDKKDIDDADFKQIKIFNNYYSDDDIKQKLVTNKIFWRDIKLSSFDDIKIIWEYNRLQFLLALAIKYLKTKDVDYKNKIVEILDIWEKNNSYEYSVNWNSNLEVAIRGINISLTLMLLKDCELNKKYDELLYFHAKHIYNEIDFSDKCIPNNHVIGEAAALLMLSKLIETKENKKWYKKSTQILKKYIDIIDGDGVSKENSFSYQWFVTKMYILSLCFIDEQKLFEQINDRINKSLNVLSYIFINKNTYLNYGDNDDGYLYSVSQEYNLVDDIISYFNFFTDNLKTTETIMYEDLFNKFNNKKILKFIKGKNLCFNNKNIFIYNNKNTLLFFNAKNIEGHAHNDSLALTLFINGSEVFLDSGTFSYNLDKKERSYYRSREAHTTILVDNNATEVGTFRWVNNINSYINGIEETDEYIKVSGLIQSICSREVKIFKNKNLIEIIDQSDKDEFRSNWIVPNTSSLLKNKILIDNINISFEDNVMFDCKNVFVSKKYLCKDRAKKIKIKNKNGKKSITTITW